MRDKIRHQPGMRIAQRRFLHLKHFTRLLKRQVTAIQRRTAETSLCAVNFNSVFRDADVPIDIRDSVRAARETERKHGGVIDINVQVDRLSMSPRRDNIAHQILKQ